MNTYPEMNAMIVGILRTRASQECIYAALRIEELEAEKEKLRTDLAHCQDVAGPGPSCARIALENSQLRAAAERFAKRHGFEIVEGKNDG